MNKSALRGTGGENTTAQRERFLSADPLSAHNSLSYGYMLALNGYAAFDRNPLTTFDCNGMYSVDTSCVNCAVDEGLVRQQTDHACALVGTRISDPKLKRCLQERCKKNGKIKCFLAGEDESCDKVKNDDGTPKKQALAWTRYPGRTAHLCLGHPSYPSYYASHDGIGRVVVHEWAHTCGWDHGDPGNVPGSGGATGGNDVW